MKKEKKNNYLKGLYIPISLAVPLLIWYITTDVIMEKLLILFIFGTIVIPLSLNIITMLINAVIKPLNNSSNNIHKTKLQPIKPKEDYKIPYKGKINPSPLYNDFKNAIVACSKNKLFKRDDILVIKESLDNLLGSHSKVYNSFSFENDIHEIYVKGKSSKLKTEDYQKLLDLINKIVAKNTKEVG